MVRIEKTGVPNQCRTGVASVMLNNQSVTRFRITYVRRHVTDEYKTAVLDAHKWLWIGCADDGYTYALHSLTPL